jgi:hypothetical protein
MRAHSHRIGIFYVIGVDLYIESMPMSEGENWGGLQNVSKRSYGILVGTDETA